MQTCKKMRSAGCGTSLASCNKQPTCASMLQCIKQTPPHLPGVVWRDMMRPAFHEPTKQTCKPQQPASCLAKSKQTNICMPPHLPGAT